jgi:hypothetical protein
MTDPSRLRKGPLEAEAAASLGNAGEIDTAGSATIAYSSEDPAHPVEHMLNGRSGPEARRWMSARPDTTEHIVMSLTDRRRSRASFMKSRKRCGSVPRKYGGSLGGPRPIVPPNSGSGIQLQPRGSHLSARRTALQSPPSHPSPSHDCSKQERPWHGDTHDAPALCMNCPGSRNFSAAAEPPINVDGDSISSSSLAASDSLRSGRRCH